MGVLVFGGCRAEFTWARDEKPGHITAALLLAVCLLDGPDDQRTD